MERSPQPDSFEFSDYVAVLRRRWWIVALAALFGLAAAAAYTAATPRTYTSSAAVYVRPLSTDASQGANKSTGGVDLDTEAQVIQSASVASVAKQMMHTSQPVSSLISRISVVVPANSQVLQIGCTGRTAAASAQCANAFAAAYLQNRSTTAGNIIQAQLSKLQQKVSALQQKVTALTLKIKALSRGSTNRITLNMELSSEENQLSLLSGHTASLVAQSANTSGGSIITSAVAPRRPSNPRPALYLPSGLAAGLLIGLVIAFWRDRSDKRVRGARYVETAAHLPVLLDLSRGKGRPKLVLAEPRSRTGQAFAELGHSIAATLGQGNHVVLVAGASPGHSGSLAAANLAAALARTGSEAILVCADLRGSITPALFGLSAGPGLAQVVIDRATVGEVERHPAEVPQLRVITPGVDGHLANYHLQRDVTEPLVNRLRARARYVIFEAPPTADGADASALAQLADAAIMAIEVPRSLRGEVLAGVRRLDRMGAAVLGAVLLPSLGKAAPPPAVPEPPAAELRTAEPPDPESPDSPSRVTGVREPGSWGAAGLADAQATHPHTPRARGAQPRPEDPLRSEPATTRRRDRYRDLYEVTQPPPEDVEPADYLVYPPRSSSGIPRHASAFDDIDDLTASRAPRGASGHLSGIDDRGPSGRSTIGRPASDYATSDRGGGEPVTSGPGHDGSAGSAVSGSEDADPGDAPAPRPRHRAEENGVQPDGAPDTIARG